MDIAYFISDLLGEQGELAVPNLGYFVQMRKSAYYNEQESKFYPPHYAIQFDPQVIDDDDTLATHITQKKKISVASAKYFIEKYITSLREQALTAEVPFGGIGYFSTNGLQLVFKPDVKTDDPSFFGFKPVEAYRIGAARPESVISPLVPEIPQPVLEPVEAVSAPIEEPQQIYTPPAPAYVPPVEQPVKPAFPEQFPIQRDTEPQYSYEEERRGISPWLIVTIVLVLLVAAIGALYKFKPELFRQLSLHKDPYQNTELQKDTAKEQPVAVPTPVTSTPDTVQVQAPKADTATTTAGQTETSTPQKAEPTKPEANKVAAETKKPENKPAATNVATKPAATATATPVSTPAATSAKTGETVAKGMWVIYGGAFPERKPAVRALENYKSLGQTQARFLKDNVKPGNNYKIILGAFNTKSEADDARKEILATAKISANRLGVEQLK